MVQAICFLLYIRWVAEMEIMSLGCTRRHCFLKANLEEWSENSEFSKMDRRSCILLGTLCVPHGDRKKLEFEFECNNFSRNMALGWRIWSYYLRCCLIYFQPTTQGYYSWLPICWSTSGWISYTNKGSLRTMGLSAADRCMTSDVLEQCCSSMLHKRYLQTDWES